MLWRRHAAPASAPAPAASAPRAQRTEPKRPARPPRHSPVPVELAGLDRAALETRLAAGEKEVADRLPIHEKYELAERLVSSEERLRPRLDEVFVNDNGETVSYELECHGQICSIANVEMPDWPTHLQQSPATSGMFHSAMFGSERGRALVELEEPRRTAAVQLFVQLVTALKISPAVADCRNAHPGTGVVEIAFHFDVPTRRLSAIASGATAGSPGAECVRRAADSLAAAAKIATDVSEMPDWAFPIEVP